MAQKLLKAKKHKPKGTRSRATAAVPATGRARTPPASDLSPAGRGRSPSAPNGRAASTRPPQEIALVATYKNKQLAWIKKHGVYNYPVKDGDEFDPAAFAQIKELWLYADTKGTRHCFAAEFVGKMTREEFLAAYPTYAKLDNADSSRGCISPKCSNDSSRGCISPKCSNDSSRGRISPKCATNKAYYIFKTTFLDYGPRLDAPDVLVRAADFATGYAKKIKKAVDAYHADGEFAPLANYLPTELSQVPRERLRVCEAAVQLNFIDILDNVQELQRKVAADCDPSTLRFIDLFAVSVAFARDSSRRARPRDLNHGACSRPRSSRMPLRF